MAAARVPINPKTLDWAMRRAGTDIEVLARAAAVKPESVSAWLRGEEQPTYRQAKRLAERLRLPFSQILLPPPPSPELPIPDFRRGGSRGKEPSPELLDAIYDALRKRDWYREYRGGERVSLPQSSFRERQRPEDVAAAITEAIPVDQLREQSGAWAEFLRGLVEKTEDLGILVLRQGYVGANSRRTYKPEEFSGFTIVDPVAPVIFLNARDFIARQIFTLVHELAHVCRRQSGLDAGLEDPEAPSEEEERFCDQVAAAVLMPREAFVGTWAGEAYGAAQAAAKRFKVSARAALRRARELQLINSKEYWRTVELLWEAVRAREEWGRGGNFWALLWTRNSRAFTRAVLRAVSQGELGLKEAASLLNVKVPTLVELLERQARVSSRL